MRLVTGRPSIEKGDLKTDGNRVPVTLEDAYSGYYSGTSFNGTWVSGNEIMFRESGTRNVLKFNAANLTSSTFLNASVLVMIFKIER